MASFEKVNPKDIPTTVGGRRGKVCYPLIKLFLDSNEKCAKLDKGDMKRTNQSLYTGLKMYVKNHDMAIKIFMAGGEIYFLRLDMDDEGNLVENWKEAEAEAPIESTITEEPVLEPVKETTDVTG